MPENILDDEIRVINSESPLYAGFWIRVGASLLDSIVMLPLIGLQMYNSFFMKSMIVMLICSVLLMLYKPVLEWKRAATYGKSMLGLKLIDNDKNPISGKQSIIRNSPWIASGLTGLVSSIFLFGNEAYLETEDWMEVSALTQQSPVNMVNMVVSLALFVAVIVVAFDSRKQGIHDMAAKTFCIRTKK